MPLDHEKLQSLSLETRHSYTRRDTILYALGVGAALTSPVDPQELCFVYEERLQVLPTMAVVLAYPGFWMKDPQYGLDWPKVLHGEQSVEWRRPLTPEGSFHAVTRVEALYDKGPGKGALLYTRREVRDEATGELFATVRQCAFLRGDGGFGGSSEGAPKPYAFPLDRSPDLVCDLPTRPEQALIYRLSGDYNPVHVDPQVAAQAGFHAPLLHGLCTYGVAGRAILRALDLEPAQLRRFDVRFSSPVFPGETIRTEIVKQGPGRAALQARVVERDAFVLKNGYLEYEA